jgi:hypothetical protein
MLEYYSAVRNFGARKTGLANYQSCFAAYTAAGMSQTKYPLTM